MQEKIRIRLEAYEHTLLDRTVKVIISNVEKTGALISGPIPLPTKIEKFTVIKSPHKFSQGREQFEIRTHRRIIDITDVNKKVVDTLHNLQLPGGVMTKIKSIIE
ncbi:MAG: 30S ribosomal protein S10 [Planctomycetota bacterium]